MFWILAFLWVTSGIASFYFSSTKAMLHDRTMVVLGIFCGATCGPFGIFWFFDKE